MFILIIRRDAINNEALMREIQIVMSGEMWYYDTQLTRSTRGDTSGTVCHGLENILIPLISITEDTDSAVTGDSFDSYSDNGMLCIFKAVQHPGPSGQIRHWEA